jgi:TolB-like protein
LRGRHAPVFATGRKRFGKNSAEADVSKDDQIIEFGNFRLNPAERSLLSEDGSPIQLTRKLYDTLLFMVERPGRLLEKQALLDAVWKGTVVEENTLSRTISALRQVLGERAGEPRYIETVSGLGYRFIQLVTVTAAPQSQAQPRRRDPSIAVLPFEDLSRERDQAYFADGIAEEVLNRLASVAGLRLIAKSSAFRFRDRTESAQSIGRRLGVDYLLVGAVRKDGERLRITAQLIEAGSDSQLWSEQFDRELALEHIFAIQEEIARAVTHALKAKLGIGIEQPSPIDGGTRDLEAYDLYLRGRALLDQGGAPGNVRGAALLREAVARDPSFAAGWLRLARATWGKVIFARDGLPQAMEEIDKAVARTVEIAPGWWGAHVAQCMAHAMRRDWLAGERSLEQAIALAPGSQFELDLTRAAFYAQVADSRALELFRAASRDDPLSLLASALYQKALHFAGREIEAETEYRRSLDLAGDREMAEHIAIHRLWVRGLPFRDQLRRYLDLTQTKPAPVLEDVYAVCDDPPSALVKLRAAASAREYQYAPLQLVLAWWLAHYGDIDEAFSAIWRGYVEMGLFTTDWLWWPVFGRVREHARFPELLDKVGFVSYWRAKGMAPSPIARSAYADRNLRDTAL